MKCACTQSIYMRDIAMCMREYMIVDSFDFCCDLSNVSTAVPYVRRPSTGIVL